ncbi:type I polyketide synthase [Amycolatopsis nivea]
MTDLFEPIAIVGISGRFPGARDTGEFWRNLVAGRESISALTDEELAAAGVPDAVAADPAYVKKAGLVPGADEFDPEFFGMTPYEAEICDPQLRLFLEVTHEAIENAGHDLSRGSRDIAVYGACGPSRYGELNVLAHPRYADASGMGFMVLNNVDYLTTLASYKLDLRGPSMAVLTACSSSLTAVHLACRSLQLGECDAAVAGAANVEIPYRTGYRWSPGDVRSADGRCRPFDASGTGTIFTSGAGAVLLKRLDDAIADADHVWGVVEGIGITNDGREKVSFSAPSVAGQAAAITAAMAMAEVSPDAIGCVELHATGTPLGDPIEVSALAGAYEQLAGGPLPPGRIPIGSVKGNIGHTIPAAGIAGLVKLALALENDLIPPTIGVDAPNPALGLERTPFVLAREARRWPRTPGAPRRGGLSSLGIGGTNVHLVVREGPAPLRTPHRNRPRLVVWSGRDDSARAANRAALAEHFAGSGEETFAETVSTLHLGRTAHQVRGAAVCADAAEAARVLGSAEDLPSASVADGEAPAVAFVFPGQGAQFPGMAAGLYGRQRVFTETVDECLEAFRHHVGDLYPVWLGDGPAAELDETAIAQPLLFAIEYALARQWQAWGIRPAAVLGHSIGELVGAAVSGVFSTADAVRLVAARGRAMQARPRGGMLVAAAAPGQVPEADGVVVAAVNAADQTVLAGSADALEAVAAKLAGAGIATRRMRTSHAFHSPEMAPAAREFAKEFAGIRLSAPKIPLYSAASGRLLSADEAVDPEFWARQLCEPVRFADAVDALTAEVRQGVLLETGPGSALGSVLRRHAAVAGGGWRVTATLPRRQSGAAEEGFEERAVLRALGDLWLSGVPVEWANVYRDEKPQRVPLPGYRFQRRRFWVDPVPASAVDGSAAADPAADGPFSRPVWAEAPELPEPDGPAPVRTALALLPREPEEARALRRALSVAGFDVCAVGPEESLDSVIGRLEHAGTLPSVLVHGVAAGGPSGEGPAEELDRLFGSLLALLQKAGRRAVGGKLPSLLVLTRDAADVSGDGRVEPARAALVAAAKTAALETPETDCRIIDLAGPRALDALVAELRTGTEEVVALHGKRRWVPQLRPWSARPDGRPAVRRHGVYVITGGTGGLGLAVAKGLAETGCQPHIALLSRTAREVPEELRALNATVRAYECDVADQERLAEVLADVAAVSGPVRGVFHLAGVAGDGMLQFRREVDADAVLRPKVRGTVALAEVLSAHPAVDYVACFSSRAALTGMVGGADYAAANAFLDAWAGARENWFSIGWPAWASVGMARGGAVEKLSAAVRAARAGGVVREETVHGETVHEETVLSPATHWVLDEHRIGGAAVLPGTAVVDLILRAYRSAVPGAAAVRLREVVFLRPLAGDAPRRTRVCLTPGSGDDWQIRVVSKPDGTRDEWEEHATAIAGPAEPGAWEPVADPAAGLAEAAPPSMLPSPDDAFVFGPRWHNVERLWERGDVTVAELALAPAFAGETSAYAVHPALLDTGAGIARRHRRGELLVPFTYRELTWYAPLTARVRSRLRTRPGSDPVTDVEFFAPDGRLLVTIDGLRMRPAKTADFTGAPDTEPGLPPHEGVRLLLSLLAAPAPPQIAVVPHGEPVPAGPVLAGPAAAEPRTPPDGSVQDRLAEMWRQILGRPSVEAADDFFDLGGDSLMGVALTGRIRDAFGVHLSIGSLFDYPTLGGLAAALCDQGAK